MRLIPESDQFPKGVGEEPDERSNPFVGPRSLAQGDPIFGREREINELIDLLIAERIVVLYSPSGAGKTSLVQAGLLSDQDFIGKFQIFETIRFGLASDHLETTDSAEDSEHDSHAHVHHNPYMQLLFASIQGTPRNGSDDDSVGGDAADPSGLDALLTSYETTNDGGWVIPQLMVFDQFEEIVAQAVIDRAAKREFFAELGTVLERPQRWALFVLREDYLAALDPFRFLLPTRFTNRYRLEFLNRNGAREAILETALSADTVFEDAAAERVLDGLSGHDTNERDEASIRESEAEIDPLQLQIVCRSVWDHAADKDRITVADVEHVESVEAVLGEYYRNLVADVARQSGVSEYSIRDWIQNNLIVEDKYRGQLLFVDADFEVNGLSRAAVDELLEGWLARIEQRIGNAWCELIHDRLVPIIVDDNARWREENLSTLQRSAILWDKSERSAALLLRDDALRKAEAWALGHDEELIDRDRELLRASQAAQTERERVRRLRRIGAVLATVAFALGIAAIVGFIRADRQRQLAEENETKAVNARATAILNEELAREAEEIAVIERAQAREQLANRLVVEAKDLQGTELDTSLLIGLGLHQALSQTIESDASVIAGLASNPMMLTHLYADGMSVQDLAFNSDGVLAAAAGSKDGSIVLWDTTSEDLQSRIAYAPGPDAEYQADAASKIEWVNGGIGFGAINGRTGIVPSVGELIVFGGQHSYSGEFPFDVTALATSDDGLLMASGSCGERPFGDTFCPLGEIALWNLADVDATTSLQATAVVTAHQSTVYGLAFHPDRPILASTGCGTVWENDACAGEIALWDTTSMRLLGEPLTGHANHTLTVEFSPDGTTLASGDSGGLVLLWHLADSSEVAQLVGVLPVEFHGSWVFDLAFNADGSRLATGSCAVFLGTDCIQGQIVIWDVASQWPVALLKAHGRWVSSLAFRDNALLASSDGASVILWDVSMQETFIRRFDGHDFQTISALAFHPTTAQLASAGGARINIWTVEGDEFEMGPLVSDGSSFTALAFDPSGMTLAAGDEAGRLWQWETTTWASREVQSQHAGRITSLAYHPHEPLLVSGGADSAVVFRNVISGASEIVPHVHQGRVTSLAFDIDGSTLYSSGVDGAIALWDTQRMTITDRVIKPDGGALTDLAFSFDGRQLLSADEIGIGGGAPILWTVKEGMLENPQRLPLEAGLVQAISQMATSSVAPLVVGGSQDGKIILWDETDAWRLIADPLPGHADITVTDMAISPDGRWLASGDANGSVLLMPLDPAVWRKRACKIANRDLTAEEWTEYFGEQEIVELCP